MPTGWESYPIEFTGGLVTNLSRLQQGIKMPGSARELVNFEPSIKGGYRRINGYSKYSLSPVPSHGSPLVQGSGQTGTTLLLANTFTELTAGGTFTIDGVAGTYTIDVAGITFDSTYNQNTITFTPALDSSPADKAAVTMGNLDSNIEGLHYFYESLTDTGGVLALRQGVLWYSTGGVWAEVNAPYYGPVLVAGGAQTGVTVALDAFSSDTYAPQPGDTFKIAGIELVYTVLAIPTVTSGASTLSIYPALDSSPADNAVVTFLGKSSTGGTKARFVDFAFDGTEKTVMVDGVNYPLAGNTTVGVIRLNKTIDLIGATTVDSFANHLFFGVGNKLVFSAPFDETDYLIANGAGTILVQGKITGLQNFRDKLIVFTNSRIYQVTGSSVTDFRLDEIVGDLGCSEPDSIQEVAGDLLFLGPDGLRFVGATARIGDFNLSLASATIQDNLNKFRADYASLCSVTIRDKSQYRIFGFNSGDTAAFSEGYLGTQFVGQEQSNFQWGKTEGLKAYRASSAHTINNEIIVFSGETGYVYLMESGNTFDGVSIPAKFYTPYIPINDPRIRKTLYKATTYYDPEGTMEGTLTFTYDFNAPSKIQPDFQALAGGGTFAIYGTATFGTDAFGGEPDTVLTVNPTGSFFTVSLEYDFNAEDTIPFIVDTGLLEFSINDRK
tara:strand:+ start:3191 stop:5191 length:2001 start_codon:yes stop_codon:yes gene_type:complete